MSDERNPMHAILGVVAVLGMAASFVLIGYAPPPKTRPESTPTGASAEKPSAAPADPLAIDPALVPGDGPDAEPIRKGADFPTMTPFARDTRTFTIPPLDGVEFNYQMEKGGSMVYTWTASDYVVWDFHGEPVGSKPGYAESYAMDEGKAGNGGFIAPTTGIHGWFWENQGDKPVKVTLTTAGHFSGVVQIKGDGSRVKLPLASR